MSNSFFHSISGSLDSFPSGLQIAVTFLTDFQSEAAISEQLHCRSPGNQFQSVSISLLHYQKCILKCRTTPPGAAGSYKILSQEKIRDNRNDLQGKVWHFVARKESLILPELKRSFPSQRLPQSCFQLPVSPALGLIKLGLNYNVHY